MSNDKYLFDVEKQADAGIRRATQHNILAAAVRVSEQIQHHDLHLGALQREYLNISTARQPAAAPVQIPSNATMQQLGHIDSMAQRHADEHASRIQNDAEAYRCVRMRLGTMSGPPINCYVAVADLREILGLPCYPLVPTFREPLVATTAPAVNMDDIDHCDV